MIACVRKVSWATRQSWAAALLGTATLIGGCASPVPAPAPVVVRSCADELSDRFAETDAVVLQLPQRIARLYRLEVARDASAPPSPRALPGEDLAQRRALLDALRERARDPAKIPGDACMLVHHDLSNTRRGYAARDEQAWWPLWHALKARSVGITVGTVRELHGIWIDQATRKLLVFWEYPPATLESATAHVRIQVTREGIVARSDVMGPSGDDRFDQSIDKAVYGASPLPLNLAAGDGMVTYQMKFSPGRIAF